MTVSGALGEGSDVICDVSPAAAAPPSRGFGAGVGGPGNLLSYAVTAKPEESSSGVVGRSESKAEAIFKRSRLLDDDDNSGAKDQDHVMTADDDM